MTHSTYEMVIENQFSPDLLLSVIRLVKIADGIILGRYL